MVAEGFQDLILLVLVAPVRQRVCPSTHGFHEGFAKTAEVKFQGHFRKEFSQLKKGRCKEMCRERHLCKACS